MHARKFKLTKTYSLDHNIIYLEIRYRTITELVYGYPIVENVMRARRQCVYQRCMVPAAITGF